MEEMGVMSSWYWECTSIHDVDRFLLPRQIYRSSGSRSFYHQVWGMNLARLTDTQCLGVTVEARREL